MAARALGDDDGDGAHKYNALNDAYKAIAEQNEPEIVWGEADATAVVKPKKKQKVETAFDKAYKQTQFRLQAESLPAQIYATIATPYRICHTLNLRDALDTLGGIQVHFRGCGAYYVLKPCMEEFVENEETVEFIKDCHGAIHLSWSKHYGPLIAFQRACKLAGWHANPTREQIQIS